MGDDVREAIDRLCHYLDERIEDGTVRGSAGVRLRDHIEAVRRAAADYRAVPTEVERLRARVAILEELVRIKDRYIVALAERCERQSELLSKRAERR